MLLTHQELRSKGGLKGLVTDKRAIGLDYTFVAQEIGIALSPDIRIGLNSRIQAFLLGTGLGALALPKTISAMLPEKAITSTDIK